jgi:hypothetical protein
MSYMNPRKSQNNQWYTKNFFHCQKILLASIFCLKRW